MNIIIFVTALILSPSAWSMTKMERAHISAARAVNEPWQDKLVGKARGAIENNQRLVERTYAIDVAEPIENADLSNVVKLADYKTIEKYFQKVRDARFIQDTNENMLRRITWMYPDDGCFARASLINDQLEEAGETPLSKVYVFGNLEVQSANAAYGTVSWWYHVAAAATDGTKVYILDPAIEPMRPLEIKEWLGRLGPDPALAVAACKPDAYTPYSDCFNPNTSEKSTDLEDQIYFLPFEKNRIVMLGRDWKKELGDLPPWLNASHPKTQPPRKQCKR